ncbi:hypothetical protein QOZ80_8AG0626720 [Eleusine coracana subsp. coracana]|nr:hypothetical protein QOZ80_8AG0626720 [Eleusine coracana subsp. coracana]
MAMAQGRPHFHLALAVVSLVLLPNAAAAALDLHLPHDAAPTDTTRSSALPPTGATEASSSPTAGLVRIPDFPNHRPASASPSTHSAATTVTRRRLLASDFDARSQEHHQAAAPSPQSAPPPMRHVHHARGASRSNYLFNGGMTFADLHDACHRQGCAADPFRRLARILYGPQHSQDGSRDIYCVVRTIGGSQPILKSSWRAAVASGCDVCYVEVGLMDDDNLRADCPTWTCLRRCTMYPHEALDLAITAISAPCSGATTSTSAVTSSAAPSPLINAALLPLLAIAFLPRPLAAAVVVVAYLPRLVRADYLDELSHATCAVYPYNNNTGAVQRTHPIPGLHEVCHCPPFSDPLPIYCAVHTLVGASSPSVFFPWTNTWRAHLPVAVTASGGDLCYVELAYVNYREGYYIHCPTGDAHAVVSCTEFPEETVRLAVWEHRELTYRDTVGPKYERYKYGAAGLPFGEYDYDADL